MLQATYEIWTRRYRTMLAKLGLAFNPPSLTHFTLAVIVRQRIGRYAYRASDID